MCNRLSALNLQLTILSAADSTEVDPRMLAFVILVAGVSLAIAILLGIVWPSKMSSVRRVGVGRPLAPLVGVLFAGLVVWLVGPGLFLSQRVDDPASTRPTSEPAGPTQRELVILNTAVPALAFAVIVAGGSLVRQRSGHRFGFHIRALPWGVIGGVTGILLTFPVVLAVMALAQWMYRQFGIQTPTEHELLRAMGDTPDPLVKYLAILAAVVVAPLWEELLFRGYIQTLLREGFIRFREADELRETDAVSVDRPRPLESWLAILLTSALFTAVHPLWMMPPIFCLSICFGLAYERTGSLWVPIVMHASFNGLMTVYFLSHS